jgi:hypothetical protein
MLVGCLLKCGKDMFCLVGTDSPFQQDAEGFDTVLWMEDERWGSVNDDSLP